MPQIRIGISGWTYPPWRGGKFYPTRLPQKRELDYASRQVNSIEINGSFYSLQRPESYRAWYRATPEEFVFSVKAGRFITHIKRLKGVETQETSLEERALSLVKAALAMTRSGSGSNWLGLRRESASPQWFSAAETFIPWVRIYAKRTLPRNPPGDHGCVAQLIITRELRRDFSSLPARRFAYARRAPLAFPRRISPECGLFPRRRRA